MPVIARAVAHLFVEDGIRDEDIIQPHQPVWLVSGEVGAFVGSRHVLGDRLDRLICLLLVDLVAHRVDLGL